MPSAPISSQLMAGHERAVPEPLGDGREQDLVQARARDRNLRPAIPSGLPARLGPDQLSMLVVEGELGGEYAGARQRFAQAQRRKLAHRVRLRIGGEAEV